MNWRRIASEAAGWAGAIGVVALLAALSTSAMRPGPLYFGLSAAAGACWVVHGWRRSASLVLTNAVYIAAALLGWWRSL